MQSLTYSIGKKSKTSVDVESHLKRAHLRQMIDHLFFAVIYAVPNLAYHTEAGEGYGIGTAKCERIMEHKLKMQKKVYNEKLNLFKVMLPSSNLALNYESFKFLAEKYQILDMQAMR